MRSRRFPFEYLDIDLLLTHPQSEIALTDEIHAGGMETRLNIHFAMPFDTMFDESQNTFIDSNDP